MSRRPAGDAIDVHVGKRVRERRVQLGLSQKKLAEAVGVSFQQIQKNERGTNRIGASRMFELSKVLSVPVTFFFDDLAPQPSIKTFRDRRKTARKNELTALDLFDSDETKSLIDAYYSIPAQAVRRRFVNFLRALRKDED